MTPLAATTLERVPFESIVPAADTITIDTPTWVEATTPSHGDTSLNGVYLAQLAPEQADARIAAVVRAHIERDAEFRWFVGPSSTPADLPDRLRRAGLVELGTSLGMSLPVPREPPPLPDDVTLHEIGDDEVDAFVRLSMRAWSRDAAFGHALTRALRRGLAHAPGLQRSWLVERGGERLAVTTLRLLPQQRLGYLQGAAVLPEQRRTGLYRATILHRLALLRELDYQHAVVWANARTSAQGCASMGFTPHCSGVFFEWRRAS